MFAKINRIVVTSGALLTLAFMLGCETEPSEQIALTITPNNVSLRPGETQAFTATGLQDYTWEILNNEADNRIAVLSNKKGQRTIYTAVSGTNVTRVLRVTANVRSDTTTTDPPGDGTSTRVSAEAIITHRP